MFSGYHSGHHQPETLRYIAPECTDVVRGGYGIVDPSRESDVYSLKMTSFSVCTSFRNHPTHYSIQLSRYNQVLTGVLPYRGSNLKDMITDIRAGKRPSRPIDSGQSRLLQDPVWNVITAGWHDKPNRRCKLSVMHHTFSAPTQQQHRGKILPRVTSFFQFLQDSESETQKRVNEMNKVNLSTHTFPSQA